MGEAEKRLARLISWCIDLRDDSVWLIDEVFQILAQMHEDCPARKAMCPLWAERLKQIDEPWEDGSCPLDCTTCENRPAWCQAIPIPRR